MPKKIKKNKLVSLNKIFCFIFVIATLLMSIGYASVNSINLDISGILSSKVETGIHIADVSIKSSGVDVNLSNINNYYQTMLSSKTVLSETDATSTVTYTITIVNNSDGVQIFDSIKYDSEFYDNDNIVFSLNGLNNGDRLQVNDIITFDITFSYLNQVLANNNILNSYLNFSFKNFHHINYVGIDDYSNYPSEVLDGENLTITFVDVIPSAVQVLELEPNNYSYSNGTLIVNNVTSDLTINCFIDMDLPIQGDGNEFNLTVSDISSSNPINVNDFLNSEVGGINLTNKVISKIEVILTYSSGTGASNSINSVLDVNGVLYRQSVTFLGKRTNATVTATFDNLNIEPTTSFIIKNETNNLKNGNVNISGENIVIYLSEIQ
ncbi:MAG: hypothetical protein PUC23_05305 [bacterium]|nr:hypothetical protein [bacterium]